MRLCAMLGAASLHEASKVDEPFYYVTTTYLRFVKGLKHSLVFKMTVY
jgi:hypothetical protein